MSDAARTRFPYAIEAKCQERVNVWSAFDQASGNAVEGCAPLVVIKRNGTECLCLVRWSDFLDLAVLAHAERPEGAEADDSGCCSVDTNDQIADVLFELATKLRRPNPPPTTTTGHRDEHKKLR